jgi:hypothetical protein
MIVLLSALPLFVAWVAADDDHFAVSPHDLAVFANAFDAGAYLHRQPRPPRNAARGNRKFSEQSGWGQEGLTRQRTKNQAAQTGRRVRIKLSGERRGRQPTAENGSTADLKETSNEMC